MKINGGFTLLELMIVVAIIGLLAAFAYPSYMDSVTKSRRADAKATLLNLAQQIERFYSENHTYTGAAAAVGGSPQASPEGWYQLTINITGGGTAYTLTAAPQGQQASHDTQCKSYTYNNLGQEGVTGTPAPSWSASDCWRR